MATDKCTCDYFRVGRYSPDWSAESQSLWCPFAGQNIPEEFTKMKSEGWVEFFVEGIRSQLPKLEEYGIATREEVKIDTLADRIEAAGRAADPQWVSARYIAAWARNP